MDKKQILAAIAILAGTFLLIIGSVVGIYFLNPEILGFSPTKNPNSAKYEEFEQVKSDSIEEEFSNTSDQSDIQYDSLKSLNLILKDSLNAKSEIIKIYNDSIASLVKRIIELDNFQNSRIDSVKIVKNRISQVLNDYNNVKIELLKKDSLMVKKKDSLTEKNMIQFAKIYDNSGPKEVAKILEKLDSKDAAKILKLMQVKKAGKVLESMKPEIAAQILLEGNV